MTRAIRFHQTGGPEVLRLEDVEVGPPGIAGSAGSPDGHRIELHRCLRPHGLYRDAAAERPGAGSGGCRRRGWVVRVRGFASAIALPTCSTDPAQYAELRNVPAERLVKVPEASRMSRLPP